MFSSSKFFVSLLAAASVIVAAPVGAQATGLKLRPQSVEIVENQTTEGSVITKKRCSLRAVTSLGMSVERTQRGYRWSVDGQLPGSFKISVRCSRAKRTISVTVIPAEEGRDGSPGEGAPGQGSSPEAPRPTNPQPENPAPLTGSDAEAERYWQQVRSGFTRLSRGWCADYAYSRRLDIPERIEKAAYKQWVADGAMAYDPARGRYKATATQGFHSVHDNYLRWAGETTGSDRDAWTGIYARRAGLTVSRTPFAGAIAVTDDHVAYVEQLLAPTEHDISMGNTYGRYLVSQMSSESPGIVWNSNKSAQPGIILDDNTYFVG